MARPSPRETRGELSRTSCQWRANTPRVLRRQIQLVWQSPRLAVDPRLRIKQIILEPMAAQRLLPAEKDERAMLLNTWVKRVGLTHELLERYPHEISEGQLQRACLARALILQPSYLICDELSCESIGWASKII